MEEGGGKVEGGRKELFVVGGRDEELAAEVQDYGHRLSQRRSICIML